MPYDQSTPAALTAQQARFAERHDAAIGLHAGFDGTLVFLYTEHDAGTQRWLIDEAGHVLQSDRFRKPHPAADKRRSNPAAFA